MSVSPFRRPNSPFWYVRREVRGVGKLVLSTRTSSEALARKYDQLLLELRDSGRFDVLAALKSGLISLQDAYANRHGAKLAELLNRATAPRLQPLVREWLASGASDRGIRDRSMQRYATSWRHVLALLPETANLSAIDADFVSNFRRQRQAQAIANGETLSSATLNRDLAAIGAFFTWCTEVKNLRIARPQLRYQRESRGRLRYLTPEELARFRDHCPSEWEALFQLLFATGMTIGEALGLRRADFDLRVRRVSIHEEYGRRLKRESRTRELSVPAALLGPIQRRLDATPSAPDDLVFPFTYWTARKAWRRVCKSAGIHGATIHDARHTFAVHAVQDGIPEARLQRLLGHSHPGTTRRYAMHAPEQFLDGDAERVARHMGLGTAPSLRIERSA